MAQTYFTIVNPQSENDVRDSFSTFTEKFDGAPPLEVPYAANTLLKLDAFSFLTEIEDRNAAVVVQIADTTAFNNNAEIVATLIKQMTDELNFNIKLSKHPYNSGYKASDRHYYGLPAGKDTYPKLITYKQKKKEAENFINGEKRRIADGKPALKSVTWDVLEIWYNIMVAKHQAHVNSFNDAKQKQIIVNQKAQDYITNIYPDMKADAISFYRKLDNDAKRIKMTEWGILYREVIEDSDLLGTITGFVTYDGTPIEDAEVFFEKDDLTIHTEERGYFSSHDVSIGYTNIIIKKEPYKEKTITHFEIKQDINNALNIELELEE